MQTIYWVKVLYSAPVASIRTNGVASDYFVLHRGMRQGCCLSQFLFDIAIESLAIAIRSESKIKSISRGGTSHKTSLYAYDLLPIYVLPCGGCTPPPGATAEI